MKTKYTAYSNFPIFSEGNTKSFQDRGNHQNIDMCSVFSFNNSIPSFVTPATLSDITVSTITLYQYSGNFMAAQTYAELIPFRDAGTALSITLVKNTSGNYYFWTYAGNANISTLDAGYYEIVIEFSDGTKYESELMQVCTVAGTGNWILATGIWDDLGVWIDTSLWNN